MEVCFLRRTDRRCDFGAPLEWNSNRPIWVGTRLPISAHTRHKVSMDLRRPMAEGSRSTVLLVLESDPALLDLLKEVTKVFGYTFNFHKKSSINKAKLTDQ
jgi:hypothetical protein